MQDIITLYISRIISTPLTDGLLARVVVVGYGGEGGDPGAEPLGPGLDGDHLLAQRREQLVRLAQQTRQLPDGLHSTARTVRLVQCFNNSSILLVTGTS